MVLSGLGAVIVLAAAAGILCGLGGARDSRLDLFNHATPLWMALAFVGGVVCLVGRPGRALLAPVLLISGLALLVGAARMGQADAGPRLLGTPDATDGPSLVVVTLNAWSGNRAQQAAAAGLLASGADVLAIQEPHGIQQVQAEVRRAFPYEAGCPRLGDCGAVILSRLPIRRSGVIRRAGGLASPDEFGLAWAEVVAPDGRPVTVLSVHLDWPVPRERQGREVARLLQTVKGLPTGDVVLAGDLNLTAWSNALRSLDGRLSPLTRRTSGLGTYPDLSAFRRWGPAAPILGLDHLYASPGLKLRRLERLSRLGSDHLAVRAEFVRERNENTR